MINLKKKWILQGLDPEEEEQKLINRYKKKKKKNEKSEKTPPRNQKVLKKLLHFSNVIPKTNLTYLKQLFKSQKNREYVPSKRMNHKIKNTILSVRMGCTWYLLLDLYNYS